VYKPFPSLNALLAFEAAARHLSLSKAAQELHVSAGALSHQIRGLEEFLGFKLFERRVRSISLTPSIVEKPNALTGVIICGRAEVKRT
jgi:LysR family glycine cleavage system transcriptional activator